jgi:FAD/FMN-containing dehydrogenase
VEHLDRRCLGLLREDGIDLRYHLVISPDIDAALLVQLELPPTAASDLARIYEQIASALQPDAPDSPLTRLCRLLDRFRLLEGSEMVLAQSVRRRGELLTVREAVPLAVNQRVGTARRVIDSRIEKTAADMIVPFDRFEECLDMFRAVFEMKGLDLAIWGHISDANVHPNVIPRTFDDVRKGREAILECGARVIEMGGCPLAEHGVGRSPVKQALLGALYGASGIDQMRAVKTTLDPARRLAPGVMFATGD